MAGKDEYIGEAYNELKKLSMDEQKRMEYELRQKAVRDHNSMIKSAIKRGTEIGTEIGRKRGEEEGRRAALRELVGRKLERGMSAEQIAELFEMDAGYVAELAEEYRSGQTE